MGDRAPAAAGWLTLKGLAWRHITGYPGSAAALVLAVVMAFGLPPLLLLIDGAAPARPSADALARTGTVSVVRQGIVDASAFDAFQADVQRKVRASSRTYLDDGVAFADVGPLRLDSINGQPLPTSPPAVQGTYASDLSRRVAIVKGELGKSVPNSLQGTVSMPVDGASRLGLGLGDVLCLGPAREQPPGAADWCARLVGLWKPLAAGDPYWQGRPSTAVFADRDDFFTLLSLTSTRGASGGRWYLPRAAAISSEDASDVAGRLSGLRAAIASGGRDVLHTDLDRSLDGYAAIGRVVALSVRVLSAAFAVLGIILVALLARHFLDLRRLDLGALRSLGWSSGRVRSLVVLELGTALLMGVILTAVTAVILTALLASSGAAISAGGAAKSYLAVFGPTLVGVLGCLGALTARPLRRRNEHLDMRRARWGSTISRGWAFIDGLLAVPAASYLFLPDRLAAQRWPGSGSALESGRFLVFVAALALLAAAAVQLLSPVASRLAGLAPGEVGTLARWRLADWRRRNAASRFLLVFAAGIATFSGGWLAALVSGGRSSSADDPLLHGLAVSIAAGFGAAVLIVLAVSAFIASTTARSRAGEDAALLLDGLPPGALRVAQRIELRLVLGLSTVAGACLGLGLASAVEGHIGGDALPLSSASVGLGLAATPLLLFGGGLLTGWLGRPRQARLTMVAGEQFE